MPKTPSKELSIVEAARLIYHTKVPTDEQIKRVYKRMKSGALRVHDYGREPLEWTTTEQDLAKYLAAQMLGRRREPPGAARPQRDSTATAAGTSASRVREEKRLRSMYFGMWREYFLAVMLRRRMAHRSKTFRRAVLAGQVVLLVAIAGCLIAAVRITREPILPERVAIERWINEHTDRHRVTRWRPTQPAPDGNGVIVEVEYRYSKETARVIETARMFRVADDEAEEIVSE